MYIRVETRNVLDRKYTVRTLIAALLSHHRLKLHVEMVDTGYRRPEYTGIAFLPHMASQEKCLRRSQFQSRTRALTNTEQGLRKQKYRKGKGRKV